MQNEYDKVYIGKMFANTPNFEFNLHEMFDSHFRSIDTSEVGYGAEVFSLTKGMARYLLHNCKHVAPDGKQVNKILRLKAHLEFNGMKDSWTNKPVVINNKTREITDGITRLYAVALLEKRQGVCMPMKLEEE